MTTTTRVDEDEKPTIQLVKNGCDMNLKATRHNQFDDRIGPRSISKQCEYLGEIVSVERICCSLETFTIFTALCVVLYFS